MTFTLIHGFIFISFFKKFGSIARKEKDVRQRNSAAYEERINDNRRDLNDNYECPRNAERTSYEIEAVEEMPTNLRQESEPTYMEMKTPEMKLATKPSRRTPPGYLIMQPSFNPFENFQ